eukprot:gene5272-3778_t
MGCLESTCGRIGSAFFVGNNNKIKKVQLMMNSTLSKRTFLCRHASPFLFYRLLFLFFSSLYNHLSIGLKKTPPKNEYLCVILRKYAATCCLCTLDLLGDRHYPITESAASFKRHPDLLIAFVPISLRFSLSLSLFTSVFPVLSSLRYALRGLVQRKKGLCMCVLGMET